MLFEIVAGGVLAGVVVPVVARHLGAGRQEQAGRTTSALLSWTLLVLTPVGVLAILGARIYAGTFTQADCAGGVQTAAALLVVFAPQIWFYGLAVISSGVLQAHHRFWAAAAAPLASSLVVIATYLVYGALADSAAAGAVRSHPALHGLHRGVGLGNHAGRCGAGADHRRPVGPAGSAAAADAALRGRRSARHRTAGRGVPGRADRAAAQRPGHDAGRSTQQSGRGLDARGLGQRGLPPALRGVGQPVAADDLSAAQCRCCPRRADRGGGGAATDRTGPECAGRAGRVSADRLRGPGGPAARGRPRIGSDGCPGLADRRIRPGPDRLLADGPGHPDPVRPAAGPAGRNRRRFRPGRR